MANARIKAVIFDAAGTLLLLREPVGETYARFAREHGVEVPSARLEEAFGRVFETAPPNVHPGEPLWRAERLEREWWHARVRETFRAADQMVRFRDFDACFEALFAHYASAAAWQVAPGAHAAVDALAESPRLIAVLSNFDQRLRPLLAGFELHEAFDAITTPADAGAAKPDRQIFDVCLKRLGLAGHRAVYVGDQQRDDMDGARAAGLHSIHVADLSSLAALPDAVDALEKELE